MQKTIVDILRIVTDSRASDVAINMCIESFKVYTAIKTEYKLIFKTSGVNSTFCICRRIEIESVEDINEILHTYHSSILGAHRGFTRMKNTIQLYYAWPTMSSDIRKYIENCEICEKTKITRHTHTPLQITSVANFPFEKIYVDFVGEINPNSQEHHKHIMSISCDLTKYALAIPTFDCTALTAAKTIVENVCLVFNIPRVIVSDNGPAFIAETFEQMLKFLGVSHVKITPYHPQSNAVERYHRTLGQYLRAYTEDNRDYWHKCIPFFVSSYNNTVHSATGYTPHSLVFGFDIEIPTNVKHSRPNYNYESYTQELQWQMKKAQQKAREMQTKCKEQNKKQYDRKAKYPLTVVRNDLVMLKREKKKDGNKFDNRYDGPYRVEQVISPSVSKIKIKSKSKIVHNDKLKLSKANHGKKTPPELE